MTSRESTTHPLYVWAWSLLRLDFTGIAFAALFFIVTTASLALLYFQLTSLAAAVLVVAAAWVLSKFSHLSGHLA